MEINIKKNLNEIVEDLNYVQGKKMTNIAKAMGYTTTTQLNHTLDGKSMISTKAVIGLIQNLNVNPVFLYTGQGRMYLTEATELEELLVKYKEVFSDHQKKDKLLWECMRENELVVRRYNDLIDITSAAMGNTKKQDKNETE